MGERGTRADIWNMYDVKVEWGTLFLLIVCVQMYLLRGTCMETRRQLSDLVLTFHLVKVGCLASDAG